MQFERLVSLVSDLPCFDLATLVQLAGEKRTTLLMQLYRWTRRGKIVALRRGMYALADAYRRTAINPATLANQLYHPSYLSLHWALGYYGLIPEKVVTYTSVTTRAPHRFANAFGQFRYVHIKQDCFFGYHSMALEKTKMLVAAPEKALLDLWHIERGVWSEERMAEMRWQNVELVDAAKLKAWAGRFNSPRLIRAVQVWAALADAECAGTRQL
jgi:predicted transcriptional regulator of viral defense system